MLNGAPVGPDNIVPFSLTEVCNPLTEQAQLLKEDEKRTNCVVLPSCIDDPGAGEGLFAGSSFKEGHVLGKYWGCLALVLDSELSTFHWFGHGNRALLLKAQPFTFTELGPARMYVVGSRNCAMSYMNTVEDDTTWLEGCQVAFFHKKGQDFLSDPKVALNCIFEEVACAEYNNKNKTFSSWEVFVNWVFNGSTQSVVTSDVEHAEEIYACYTKQYPWTYPKMKSRK